MTDHARILKSVMEKFFPDEKEREEADRILNRYGVEEFQREAGRVRLAILKLAGKSPDRLRYYTLQACRDYRDVLLAAEYPGQVGKSYLREKDPELYAAILQKDLEQYQEWYLGIIWGEDGAKS